jgi:hypothetical protein
MGKRERWIEPALAFTPVARPSSGFVAIERSSFVTLEAV